MKINVYFCKCGDNVSSKVDPEAVRLALEPNAEVNYSTVDFLCSEEGKQAFGEHLGETRPDRVVVAACSPREYETTFQGVLGGAGINPYFLQMVNIREHVAWVTPDPAEATGKALRLVEAAVARVPHHEPLAVKEIDANSDAVVIGAGPAGLKCALTLAEAGRHVTVVEKAPMLGGLPMRYEELFPTMECGPCLLEPMLAEAMHGRHAANIELLTLAEVVEVNGYHGNFTVKIRQKARFVDEHACIGCVECLHPCPVSTSNEFDFGLGERRAISFGFPGVLPNAPYIDESACLRMKSGEDCHLCLDACPVPEAIVFNDREKLIERQAGAIVVATGAGLLDHTALPEYRRAARPGVYTNLEFERILAANGPTGGELRMPETGVVPETIAMIHCVGSLDPEHVPYCSGVCCSAAFKLSVLGAHKSGQTHFVHLYKELSLAGKDDFEVMDRARRNSRVTMERYTRIAEVGPTGTGAKQRIRYYRTDGSEAALEVDMVVVSPAIVPSPGLAALARTLDVDTDRFGFLEEAHGRIDSARGKLKGIYLAGSCQAPADIARSANQGMAAAGYVLSGLVPGRKLEVDPVRAHVNETRCSGCKICQGVCPYRAIGMAAGGRVSAINELLCQGCGTCVAACPSGAIRGPHFTDEQILAELEALLP